MDTQSKMIKVLLIEDNPGDARLIQEMVYEVDGAEFVLEHVDRLSTGLERLSVKDVDVVLLDLGLPDSSGFDTFTSVQSQVPEVAIVVLTGLEDKTVVNNALQAGAQDYLSKNQLDSNLLMRSMRYAIERKKAQRCLEHMNSVLKAIRNVNQLIIVEKDRGSLLQEACDVLIEARGYNAAWLGLLQDDGTFATVVGSGFGEDVSHFRHHVMNGSHPPCIKKALAQKDPLVVLDKSRECGDCFFKEACIGKDAAIIRIEHTGRFFGLLAVLLAPDVTVDDEEKGLLQEVASDIGIALHNIELEEALRESEGKYRSLIDDVLDTSDVGITILDVEFKVVWINHSTEKYFGLKREDVIGKDKRQLIRKRIKDIFEYPETFMQKVFATYDNNTYIENFECHVLPDEERKEYWLEHWSQPIRSGLYKGGRIEHYSDITECKQAEKELAKYRDHLEELVKERTRDLEAAQEELIKRERLSVLGQLTATVSHDIRNPLGVIRSSSFYIQRKLGGDVDEKIIKHLNRIEKQIDLCDTIVGDLLEFTRGKASQVIHGEINPLLEEVLEETTTPEQVALSSELSPELPMVHFDRDKMRRVMINLILNAFQAVTMRRDMWNDEEDTYQPLVKVTSSKADNRIRIEVEDNGTGMDHETARRAFEPLFTRWARGTGLGLAIVKKIVDEHSGSVSLESIPDHGTKVTIVIPTEK